MIPVAITNNISALRCRLLVQLIQHAGGIPILIPTLLSSKSSKQSREQSIQAHLKRVESILSICKAVIIPGNRLDVPPSFYGETFVHRETAKRSARSRNNVRFETECFMIEYVLKNKLPFIGICGGMQLMNTLLGGTLVQHLPDEKRVQDMGLVHMVKKSLQHVSREARLTWERLFIQYIETNSPSNIFTASHSISVLADSYLGEQYSKEGSDLSAIQELSVHHQGCFDENLSSKLRAIAYAPDGVVEAAELRDYPTMGLLTQFHWEANVGGIALKLIKTLLACTTDNVLEKFDSLHKVTV